MNKIALVTGVTGMDGSHLAELLLSKKYIVHGTIRRSSSFNTGRIDHIFDQLHLHYADITDGNALFKIIADVLPDEIYNLAAQSHVKVSFDEPVYTADVDALGTAKLLESVKSVIDTASFAYRPKIYQASSSEMMGKSYPPQNEQTPFYPRSPYGCAKVFSYHLARNYRDAYDMFISNGILFNHSGPRRGETFVERKISRAVGRIKFGIQDKLVLGNLQAIRDWGFGPDFVEAMWLMLQQNYPDDYVIATGEAHSIQEFLEEAFSLVGLDWQKYVEIDMKYFRPAEVDFLQGDYTKARLELGWEPKVRFKELVKIMVDHDMKLAAREYEQTHVRV